MDKDNEIKITVRADISDLEKDMEKATRKVDQQADKMEKSFQDLSKSLDKLKKNMNNALSTNTSNFSGLTTQLNKLSSVATTVGNKIKSTLTKAFNVQGKVTVKQDVQTTNTSNTSSGGNGSALADSLMTGGTIGAMMNKQLSIMNKNILSTIPKSFKGAIDKSEGMFANMGNSIQKVFSDLANTVSKGTIGKVKEYRKLGEDLQFLRNQSALTKTGFMELLRSFKRGIIDAEQLGNGLKITQRSLKNIREQAKGRNIDLNFNNADKKLMEIREQIKGVIAEFNKGDIDQTTMVKKIMALGGKVQSAMQQTNNVIDRQSKAINASLASIDQKSFGYRLGEQFEKIGVKANASFKKIQASVNELKRKLSDTTIGKGLTTLNTTIKTKVSPAFQVLQGRCKQLLSGFKKVGNGAKKMGSDTKQATNMMKSGFGGLMAMLSPFISIFAIFQGLKTSITSYVDSLQDSTKFATVFKGETQEMAKWVDELNSRVTMGKSEIMDFSSNLYRMGLNMGVASDDAMQMSQSMTELGADLVQFTGDANAIDALAGALRGEYDSIQNYGYALSASAVEAKALAMGLDASSDSARMLATQTLLLEQSGDVLGYTARNSQSLAVQLAFLRKNFQALGQSIASCFAGLLQIVVPVLNRIVQAVTATFNKIASVINQVFAIFGIKVGGGGGGSIGGGGGISGAIGAIGDTIGGVGDAIDSVSDGLGGASSGADKLADNLADGAKNAQSIVESLSLMNIDQINNIDSPDDGGSSGSGGSGSGSPSSGGSGGLGSGGSGGVGDLGGLGDVGGGLSDALIIDDSVISENEIKIGELARKIANALMFIGENFKIGWDKTSGYVQSAVERLKGAFVGLGQAIEEHLVGFANNGGARLIQAIGEISGSLFGLATNIGASVIEIITGLVSHLNPANNPITRFFIDSFSLVLENIASFARSFSGWWDTLVDGGLGHFINTCGDVIVLIGGLLCEAIGTAIGWVQQFFDSFVGQAILEGVAGFIDMVATAIDWLVKVISENRELVYGFAIGFGAVFVGAFVVANAGIIAIIAGITALVVGIGWLWDNWDMVWGKITDLFNTVKDKITGVISDIWGEFEDKFPNCAKTVKTVFTNMKTIVTSIFDNIKTIIVTVIKVIIALFTGDFSSIKDIVKKAMDKIKSNISTVWNAIKQIFSTVWNAIKSLVTTVITNIVNTIKTKFNTAKSNVTTILNNIKSTFTTIWNNIKTTATTIISNIVNTVKDKFNSAKTTATNIWNGIKTGITNAINATKTSVTNVVTTISNGIKNGFTNAKNTAINVFNTLKSKITGVMNGIRDTIKGIINKITGFFSGAKFSLPHIKLPHFSIQPSGWKISDLLEGSIPKLGISWYSDGRPTTNTAITLINRAKSVELLIS